MYQDHIHLKIRKMDGLNMKNVEECHKGMDEIYIYRRSYIVSAFFLLLITLTV